MLCKLVRRPHHDPKHRNQKHYRTIGHGLNPIVTIAGNGLSDGVVAELERALNDHELIKVKLAINDREERKEMVVALCDITGAHLVQEIGKVALIYRAAARPDPKNQYSLTNLWGLFKSPSMCLQDLNVHQPAICER